MKRVGDLMRELGFKEDGPEDVKKAFIMNLFKAAYPNATPPPIGTTASPLTEARAAKERTRAKLVAEKAEEQLAFDFDAEGPCELGSPPPSPDKARTAG